MKTHVAYTRLVNTHSCAKKRRQLHIEFFHQYRWSKDTSQGIAFHIKGKVILFVSFIRIQILLCVNQHQKVDQNSVDHRVEHESTGSFRLKDGAGNGVHLGRGNDEKEEGRLHAVENTRVHVYIDSIFYILCLRCPFFRYERK